MGGWVQGAGWGGDPATRAPVGGGAKARVVVEAKLPAVACVAVSSMKPLRPLCVLVARRANPVGGVIEAELLPLPAA